MNEISKSILNDMPFLEYLEFETLGGISLKSTYDYINAKLIYAVLKDNVFNKIILMHPTGKSTISHIAVIAAFAAYQYNLKNQNFKLKNQLKPGDRVKVYGNLGRVIKFEKLDYMNSDYDEHCKAEFANSLIEFYPKSDWWKIKKYEGDATELEKYKKNEDSYQCEKTLATIFDCSHKKIRLHGNNQILIVDNKSFLVNELRNLMINSLLFASVFPTGYYSSADDFSRLPGDEYQRKPFINLSSNLYTASNLIRKKSEIETLIINGFEKVKNYRIDIDRIVNRETVKNIIILVSPRDYSEIDSLKKLGFDFWGWTYRDIMELHDKQEIKNIPGDNYYYKSLKNLYKLDYSEIKIDTEDEIKELRSEILNLLNILKENMREEEKSTRFLTIAYSLIYNMQTITFPIECLKNNDNYRLKIFRSYERLKDLKQEIIGIYIERKYKDKVDELIIKIHDYITFFKAKNLKLKKLLKIINKGRNKKVAILLRKKSYFEVLEDVLSDYNLYNDISFITFKDLKNSINFDQIIITGWMGYKNIRKLFFEGYSAELKFILYDYEYNNYYSKGIRSIVNEIKRIRNERVDIPLVKDSLKDIESKEEEPYKINESLIDEIEKLYKKRFLIQSESTGDSSNGGESKVKAYPVLFDEGEYYAYLTLNYNARKLDRDNEDIEKVSVTDLRVGDEIIFTVNSKKDIFSKLLDLIEENDEEVARLCQLSNCWREALIEYTNQGVSLEMLASRFEEMGHNHCEATIKNWLNSEEIIGPRDFGVIDSIAELTGDSRLINNKEKIKGAISSLRSLHNKLGKYLARTIVRSLIKEEKDSEINNLLEKINLTDSLTNYAEVVEITMKSSEYRRVDSYNTNKLIENL